MKTVFLPGLNTREKNGYKIVAFNHTCQSKIVQNINFCEYARRSYLNESTFQWPSFAIAAGRGGGDGLGKSIRIHVLPRI